MSSEFQDEKKLQIQRVSTKALPNIKIPVKIT